jgi:hypothetical protein
MGLVRPTWLLCASVDGYNCGIGKPNLCWTKLPAALGRLFTRGVPCRGPFIEQMPGRRGEAGWLR